MRMLRVEIRPSKEQRGYFEKCFGVTRYIYNRCVDANRADAHCSTHIGLRQRVLESNRDLPAHRQWLADVAYDTRQLAIKEFAAGLAAARTNRREGHCRHFHMEYRTRHERSQTFHVDHRAVRGGRLFPQHLQATSSAAQLTLQRYFTAPHDFRVQRESNRYYLLLPSPVKPRGNCPKLGVVALDPGVRSFQTFYSPDGLAGEISIAPRVHHYRARLAQLIPVRRGQRRLRHRLITKIRNVAADLHWKTANFLCRSFETVLIPDFRTQQMSVRAGRKLHRTTVSEMQMLSHFTFRQRLIHKAKMYGTRVLVVNEAYTSKTCSGCGRINARLGSSKHFSCPCGVECDRDLQAARGIFLRTVRNTY